MLIVTHCFSVNRDQNHLDLKETSGGLIPAVLLSHKTGIPYQQISTANTSPEADLSHVLFVDDICDSGKTLEKIRKTYNKCRILTLLNKT